MSCRRRVRLGPRSCSRRGPLLCPPCSVTSWLVTAHTWHVLLTVAGATFQIVGLSWLVANASRERGAAYGDYGVFRRVWNWFAFWLGRPPEQHEVQLTGLMAASGSAAEATLRAGEPEMERLQRELSELRARVEASEARTVERFAAVQESIQRNAGQLQARIDEVATRQQDLHRGALRKDVLAGRLFIAGAILSAVGSLV
jgi:hypothetical protein